MGGVMLRAGQHIMDSTTYNFGPLVVAATNFAGPLDGPRDVNIRTAVGVTAAMVPAKASNSILEV